MRSFQRILIQFLSFFLVEKPSGLTIASPPQLYSPSSRSQASVIQRLARPPQGRQPFSSGELDQFIFYRLLNFNGSSVTLGQSPPQRFFAPSTSIPPHSIPSTGSVSATHSRPYHAPNVTVASGQRPPPLVPPPHTSGHLPHPMYM